MDPDAAELDELAHLGPGIGLGHEEDEVAVWLGPDIGGEVAVAEGHRIVFVGAEAGPGHVIGPDNVQGLGWCEEGRQ